MSSTIEVIVGPDVFGNAHSWAVHRSSFSCCAELKEHVANVLNAAEVLVAPAAMAREELMAYYDDVGKSYACVACRKLFISGVGLRAHMTRVHGGSSGEVVNDDRREPRDHPQTCAAVDSPPRRRSLRLAARYL